MKRALLMALAVALVAAPAAFAQEKQDKQDKPANPPPAPAKKPPVDPADVETLTGRPSTQAAPRPAPKKGAPLDWRDVDILTGKANGRSGQRSYVNPYVYVDPLGSGRGYTGSQFTDNQFAPVSTQTAPLFAPRAFGRVRDHSFVVFGNTAGPSRFVFGQRSGGRAPFFFILP
jgi:hypothetical protein